MGAVELNNGPRSWIQLGIGVSGLLFSTESNPSNDINKKQYAVALADSQLGIGVRGMSGRRVHSAK